MGVGRCWLVANRKGGRGRADLVEGEGGVMAGEGGRRWKGDGRTIGSRRVISGTFWGCIIYSQYKRFTLPLLNIFLMHIFIVKHLNFKHYSK